MFGSASQSSQIIVTHRLKKKIVIDGLRVIRLGHERFSSKDEVRTCSSRWGLPGGRMRQIKTEESFQEVQRAVLGF